MPASRPESACVGVRSVLPRAEGTGTAGRARAGFRQGSEVDEHAAVHARARDPEEGATMNDRDRVSGEKESPREGLGVR